MNMKIHCFQVEWFQWKSCSKSLGVVKGEKPLALVALVRQMG